ncbi:hypothetical protein C8R45DRAFT_923998 [Mycena sanguinolenta]|nr:hypothetical protein C8R45DRAFT_923998 [Mycena sanguinolenta]
MLQYHIRIQRRVQPRPTTEFSFDAKEFKVCKEVRLSRELVGILAAAVCIFFMIRTSVNFAHPGHYNGSLFTSFEVVGLIPGLSTGVLHNSSALLNDGISVTLVNYLYPPRYWTSSCSGASNWVREIGLPVEIAVWHLVSKWASRVWGNNPPKTKGDVGPTPHTNCLIFWQRAPRDGI